MKSDETWVILFYAGWHKDSGKFMPEYHKLSLDLKDSAQFIKIKSEARMEKRFKVKQYPSIRIMRPGKENKKTKLAVHYDVKGDGNDMNEITKIIKGFSEKADL